MKITFAWRIACVATIAFALSMQGFAQSATPTRLAGLINHYTTSVDASGPWHIVGEWTLTVRPENGKVDFFAAVSMVKSDAAARNAHTHHIALTDGQVTRLANGYRISGPATITGSGSLAGFSGSPIDVEVTGASAVPFSNLAVKFGGGAARHFGEEPVQGVVTRQ